MKIFAENFRGFKQIEVDLTKINFLVGDNSSGKSSILHLADCILRNELTGAPRLNDDLGVGIYDYFSPYFKNADVTFGFTETIDSNEFSKIITVKKTRAEPYIKSCSYISNDMAITLTRTGENVRTRIKRNIDNPNLKERLSIHHNGNGFSAGIKFLPDISLGERGIVFAFIRIKDIKDEGFTSLLFGKSTLSARIISPLRALPEKFYTLKGRINSRDAHFAAMWLDLSKVAARDTLSDIEKFGKESGLFEAIKIRRLVKNLPDSPLIASVVKSNKEFFLNQVGVGVSQVVPVLIETIFSTASNARRKIPVLIQQPELHLHPIAQAALGSFFFRAGRKGVRGLLETHSSFLIDRFRAEIRDQNNNDDDNFSHENAVILFCENSVEGNKASTVNIKPDGQISGEPDTYHKFFVDELVRTMF